MRVSSWRERREEEKEEEDMDGISTQPKTRTPHKDVGKTYCGLYIFDNIAVCVCICICICICICLSIYLSIYQYLFLHM